MSTDPFPSKLHVFPRPLEVEPGIKCIGYYWYRNAVIWSEPRLRFSWQAKDGSLSAQVRDKLNHLRHKAQCAHRSEGGRDFADNHQVVLWEMHGHKIYVWYTDGSCLVGLEVEEGRF